MFFYLLAFSFFFFLLSLKEWCWNPAHNHLCYSICFSFNSQIDVLFCITVKFFLEFISCARQFLICLVYKSKGFPLDDDLECGPTHFLFLFFLGIWECGNYFASRQFVQVHLNNFKLSEICLVLISVVKLCCFILKWFP